jgi:hypothetical protein
MRRGEVRVSYHGNLEGRRIGGGKLGEEGENLP